MAKACRLILIFASLACAQTARFPSAIATNQDLTDLRDRAQSQLSGALNSTATSFTVVSGAKFAANMILTIDNEQIKICGVSGSTITVGHSSCPNVDGRAFAGTTAASHVAASLVSNFYTAYSHKALREEIKAIETALGPGLSNIPVSTPVTLVSADYDFTPQLPGGSLTAGIANTITMAPCRLNGSDTYHDLYVSGGTGTAERVRITGGTCTLGASSGTLIFTPANSHSGAWTIQSATAGIYEACNAASTPANVIILPGEYDIYGTIVPSANCTIDGQGSPTATGPSGAVNLHMRTNGIPLFDVLHVGVTIKNLQLSFGEFPAYTVDGSPAAAGSVCIQSGVSAAVDSSGNTPYYNNIICNNFYNNLKAAGGTVRVQNYSSLAAVQDGFVLGSLGAGYMEAVLAQGSGGNGYTLNGPQAALQWHSVNCFGNAGWGIKINAGAAFQMDDVDCEGDKQGEIWIAGAPPVGILQNVIIEAAGQDPFHGVSNTAPGLKVAAGNMINLMISNIRIASTQGNGMEIDGNYLQINNAFMSVIGDGEQSGHTNCVTSAGYYQSISNLTCFNQPAVFTGGGVNISNSHFIGPMENAGNPNGDPAIRFGATAANLTFCGNEVEGGPGVAIQYDSGATGTNCANNVFGTITGTLGYDGRSIQTLRVAPIPNATALSVSSNTIAPTLPLHTVGAGLIKTITAPNIGVSVCVDLVASAAFTTDNTGNIISPAITASIGKLYHACYNAGAAAWSLTN